MYFDIDAARIYTLDPATGTFTVVPETTPIPT
ncbi:MAG: hypothetical protein JWN52_4216 [Actinomycetia bacterium]|nr:hypothetical protein [Actinomycetes bacterium]